MAETVGPPRQIKLWDLPVRIIHWSFVLLLPAMWWTAEERNMELHRTLGTVFLGLLLFRLAWGVFGSETARFGQFLRGPSAIWRYLRGQDAAPIGHNPLGGWSVVALLGLLGLQMGLGLFAQDVDGMESGPLSYLVSYDTADAARLWHGRVFNMILALVALHISAVVFHLSLKGDNILGPMVTGKREAEENVAQPATASVKAFLFCALFAGTMAWWISVGAPLSLAQLFPQA